MSGIIRLTAANVKRLKAVEITPTGAIVEITGRNGQGKSSVLDTIVMGLGGKAMDCPEVVRRGEDSASAVLELDNGITVKRSWTPDGKQYLSVIDGDGNKIKSPQGALDSLVGRLSFDPLAYARMKPAEQVATLKQIVGLDFSALDKQRAMAYEARTATNRELERAKAQLAAMPPVENPPAAEVVVSDLIALRDQHQRTIAENNKLRAYLKQEASQIDDMQSQAENLRQQLSALTERIRARNEHYVKTAMEASKLSDPDLSGITDRIRNAEADNARYRAAQARAEKADAVKYLTNTTAELTQTIEEIDENKKATLASAAMPVPGLSFDGDSLLMNGLPFEQASQAQRLLVSVAMGLALNPTLRIMLIRDGSLLDSDSMAQLAAFAEANDAQVWIETVSDGDGQGFIIEDGTVAAPPTQRRHQAAQPTAELVPALSMEDI